MNCTQNEKLNQVSEQSIEVGWTLLAKHTMLEHLIDG